LFACVFRVTKPGRKRYVWMRYFRDRRIAKKRQNRVVERRCGDLDLAALRELAVDGHHVPDHLDLLTGEQTQIFRCEVAALGYESLDEGVAGLILLVEPGELRQDL
jgi:hypothetical protein